jgi:hypothetical protein
MRRRRPMSALPAPTARPELGCASTRCSRGWCICRSIPSCPGLRVDARGALQMHLSIGRAEENKCRPPRLDQKRTFRVNRNAVRDTPFCYFAQA